MVFSIAQETAAWSSTSSASFAKMSETLLCARFAKMSDSVQLSKPTALGREESWSSSRPCHPLAPHAILQQRLHGVQHRARDIGMVLHLQHELRQDERGSAAYETNSAWTRRILALSMSSGSNQSAPAAYLLRTASSTIDYREFSITHATAALSSTSSESFARMSEGVQLSKPTALGREESRHSARRPNPNTAPPPSTYYQRSPAPDTA